jgi:hypothetical protein
MKYMGCILLVLISRWVLAAPSTAVKPTSTAKILAGAGVSFGGIAGSGFTLLDFRRTADFKKKIERLVIDIGDINGNPQKGWPGYYFAELKNNPQQLVIDFSQMPNSRVTSKQIGDQLNGSLAVLKSNMSVDPLDGTLNLTLNLKSNTKVQVYQVSGQKSTSKVVVDFIVE